MIALRNGEMFWGGFQKLVLLLSRGGGGPMFRWYRIIDFHRLGRVSKGSSGSLVCFGFLHDTL